MSLARGVKRLCASLAIASVAAGSFIPATAQEAQPVANPTTITQNNGSLTVHKHEQPSPASTTSSNGKEITNNPPAKPIQGVTFKVQKVKNIDLKTNEGWKLAAEKIAAYKQNPTSLAEGDLETGTSKDTGANGVAAFADLPIGLYLVSETSVANAKNEAGQRINPVPAKPFLVTIPLTDQDNHNSWIYNVHVYPKNSLVNIDKTVEDAKKNLGDLLNYTVTAAIPSGENLDKFVIIDPLPSQLTYNNAEGAEGKAQVTLENAGDVALADGDYTIDYNETKKILKVSFTKEGLKKLVAARKANPAAAVKLVFGAKLTDIPVSSDGTITNTVYLVPSTEYSENPEVPDGGIPPVTPTPPGPTPPGVTPPGPTPPTWPDGKVPPTPSVPVTSKYGRVSFKKANGTGEEAKALAGAKFKLAYCEDVKANEQPSKFITINGKNEWVSDDQGAFTIEGIHVSDYKNNNAETADTNNAEYCLFETEAPAGYERLPEPIKFNVTSSNYQVVPFGTNIVNYPKNGGFNLPLTGSNVLIVLTLGGALLIIGGGIVLYSSRRRA